jgi:hypothetical protein
MHTTLHTTWGTRSGRLGTPLSRFSREKNRSAPLRNALRHVDTVGSRLRGPLIAFVLQPQFQLTAEGWTLKISRDPWCRRPVHRHRYAAAWLRFAMPVLGGLHHPSLDITIYPLPGLAAAARFHLPGHH